MIDLKPGLELDTLIAERVMGLRDRLAKASSQAEHEQIRKLIDFCPPYSTSIASAWEVVEKLREFDHPEDKSAGFTIWQHWEGGYVAGWSWHEAEYGVVTAETAPHAICLAALKAVGEPSNPPPVDEL